MAAATFPKRVKLLFNRIFYPSPRKGLRWYFERVHKLDNSVMVEAVEIACLYKSMRGQAERQKSPSGSSQIVSVDYVSVHSGRSVFKLLSYSSVFEKHTPTDLTNRKPIIAHRVLEAVSWILNTEAQWNMLLQ